MKVEAERVKLRIAIQKSGRLFEQSWQLLHDCGISFDRHGESLLRMANEFPLELLLVRDDDIPELLNNGVCDLGIVGSNVYQEKKLFWQGRQRPIAISEMMSLGFAHCRLALAAPAGFPFSCWSDINNTTIATSYPEILDHFLRQQKIDAEIIVLSGAIEIAPRLQIADLICDLVSSGSTLRANGLNELATVFDSESLLLRNDRQLPARLEKLLQSLVFRINAARRGEQSRYLMLHCQRQQLANVGKILPGSEKPTVLELQGGGELVAVHAVCPVENLWETIEQLKSLGASSLMVLPIERAVV